MINILSIIAKQFNWNIFIHIAPLGLLAGIITATNFDLSASYWLEIAIILLPIITILMRHKLRELIWIIAILWLGLTGGWRAQSYLQPNQIITLSKPYRFVQLHAKIEAVEAISLGKYRIIINHTTSQTFAPQDKNVRLRLNVRADIAPKMGDLVQFYANIFPPSRPAIQNGADFARYFYIKNIGGVGYSMGKIKIISSIAKPKLAKSTSSNITPDKTIISPQPILRLISLWRVNIDDALLHHITPPQTGIAIALITGGRAAIPADINQAMQISGITHILSISGLHMSMVCGLLYFGLRLLLAAIAPLALHLPIKQYCAFAALLSGGIYLALADFPIPAIRAYVMIALIFVGIICNRDADTLRSLVIAAIGLLLYNPLIALDIGFQLSFIATYALIIAYRRLNKFNAFVRQRGFGVISRGLLYVFNIIISSVVAGLVTAPLVLFHFGLFSSYSVLTNVMILPILSFMVMPALIFGLMMEWIWQGDLLLQIADYGLSLVIYCSNWVASQPQSSLHLPNMSFATVAFMMIILLLLLHCNKISTRNICIFLLAIFALIISYWLNNNLTTPDIMVAEDASAIAVKVGAVKVGAVKIDEDKTQKWLLLRGSAGNFFVKQWAQSTKGEYISYAQAKKAGDTYGFKCDTLGCDGVVSGQNIRTRYDYHSSAPLCLPDTQISIASFYAKKSYYSNGNCYHAKVKIERDMLERLGSFTVRLNNASPHQLWNSCQVNHPPIWLRCR